MKDEKLKEGFIYIVKEENGYGLKTVKCQRITSLCYKLQYENKVEFWIEKREFDAKYSIIEELPL